MHSQSHALILCLLLTIREVLSLPVKISPYNLALGNPLPQADLGNPSWDFQTCSIARIVHEIWELLHRDTWGSGEVSPHLATCQRASSLPLAAGRSCCFCWPPQHQLSNWPVQFLRTIFSYPLDISHQRKGSWKFAWGVPVLRITTSLKWKLRLGCYFETILVPREI